MSVVLKSKTDGSSYAALTDVDARAWRPDLDSRASNTAAYRDLSFWLDVRRFGSVPVGDYDIYLKINDPKETTANKRSIRFANKGDGIWDAGLGANLDRLDEVVAGDGATDVPMSGVMSGNGQANVNFAIASPNGKAYSVFLKEFGVQGRSPATATSTTTPRVRTSRA